MIVLNTDGSSHSDTGGTGLATTQGLSMDRPAPGSYQAFAGIFLRWDKGSSTEGLAALSAISRNNTGKSSTVY